MSRKPPLTMDEHRELGMALAIMRDDLTRKITRIGANLPKAHRVIQDLLAAVARIDRARSDLEDVMVRDHASSDPEGVSIYVYYPPAEQRQQVTA
jgi:hypothetical protein